MRREEMLAVEMIAKEKALKAKAARAANAGAAKPAPGLFSVSSLTAMGLLLLGAATFVAMLMKGTA
jgi:hypothetical protein